MRTLSRKWTGGKINNYRQCYIPLRLIKSVELNKSPLATARNVRPPVDSESRPGPAHGAKRTAAFQSIELNQHRSWSQFSISNATTDVTILRPETNSFKDYSLAILCMYFLADTSGRQPYFLANDFSTNVTVTCLVKRQELRTLTSPDQQSSQVTLSYVRADISMKWLSSQTLLFRNRRSANGSQTILVSARTTSSGSVCAALLKLGNQS